MALSIEECINAIEICYNDKLQDKCDKCPYQKRCKMYGKNSVIFDSYYYLRQYKDLLKKDLGEDTFFKIWK